MPRSLEMFSSESPSGTTCCIGRTIDPRDSCLEKWSLVDGYTLHEPRSSAEMWRAACWAHACWAHDRDRDKVVGAGSRVEGERADSVQCARIGSPGTRSTGTLCHPIHSRTALSALEKRERPLLDAAHIVADRLPEGVATVTNGLAMCPTHHRAYDQDVLLVTESYRVEVRRDRLDHPDAAPTTKMLLDYDWEPLLCLRAARQNHLAPQRAGVEARTRVPETPGHGRGVSVSCRTGRRRRRCRLGLRLLVVG